MKKSISLLLATLFCFSFGGGLTACGGETDNSSSTSENSVPENSSPTESIPDVSEPEVSIPNISVPDDGETPAITEEEWNAAIAPISFENYTMITSGFFIQNDGTEMQQDQVIKVTADRMTVSLVAVISKMLGESLSEPRTETVFWDYHEAPAEVAAQKGAQEQLFLALLSDYNNFVWNEEKQAFVNTNPVSIEIPMEYYAVSVSVVMENGVVSITEDGKIKTFTCDYTQTTVLPESTIVSMAKNFSWTFSDYGTTVIELDQPEQE